jgi:hypothetical protein
MSNSVDSVVKSFGEFVTGQINITWNTRQTAEQFLEIREQGIVDETDKVEFTAEEFIEYVRANTSDIIQQTLESFGQIGLEKEIFVLSEDGDTME